MEIPRSENNCSAMTQLISSMTGLDPHQVRAELGCVPAMDYHVDNETFNSVVDWYAARSAIQM
ncbi:hypothetical protein GE09DRAFT_1159304 [Coniochaeta sp. 2T2.1]|nr:hypothetical protein GE09DRAFT_1159304 [Coniochaeta sp. 2T2.1]